MSARALRAAAVVALALPLGSACATSHGKFDFDAAASFASYRTFAFVHPGVGEAVALPTDDVAHSELNERRVRASLERELAAKGLEPAPEASADLLVAFNVSSRRTMHDESYPAGLTHRWPHGWWHDHWDFTYMRIYTEGLMVVDLIDAKSRQLVWRGWTTDPLPRSGAYERLVDHAVAEVLSNYPPRVR